MSKALLSITLLALMLMLTSCARVLDVTTSEPIYVHPGKRTLGAKIDDRHIETIAKVNMHKAHKGLFEGRVAVDSHNAVVLLTGQVATSELVKLAGATVEKINTVRQVHNELQVGPIAPLSVRTHDTWLTTKIKTQLLADSDIPGSRVQVITEAGTVFLMGMLSRREADRVTDIARTTSGVKKVVKVFEYID